MKILLLADIYPDQVPTIYNSTEFDNKESLKIIEKTQGWAYMMICGLKIIGHEVKPLLLLPKSNTNNYRTIIDNFYIFNPNIVIVENARLLSVTEIRELKSKFNDCIFVTHYCSKVKENLYNLFDNYDKVLCCSPSFIKSLPIANNKKLLFYNACPEQGFKIIPNIGLNQKINKCIFAGSLFRNIHEDRKKLLSFLQYKKIPLDIYSSYKGSTIVSSFGDKVEKIYFGKELRRYLNKLEILIFRIKYPYIRKLLPPCYNFKMLTKLSNYTCCLNVHTKDADKFAANLRLFESASVGTCLVTENFSNISDLFEPDKEILTYSSREECVEKIKYCLDNPRIANEIGENAKVRAFNNHRYIQRIKDSNIF